MIALVLGIAAVAFYLWGARRYTTRYRRAWPTARTAAYAAGTAAMTAVLLPQFDALADESFAWHMVQHLGLILVGAPLILLGAPLLLMLATLPVRPARAIARAAHSRAGQAIFAPVTGWVVFIFTLWGAHFSPLYEFALEHEPAHVAEHLLFILAAMLFWLPVVQVGFVPRPMAHPARMLYLFLAIPWGAFLGLAIYAARTVLYPHYLIDHSRAWVLADQANGGAVMWLGGGFLLFVSFITALCAWAYDEERGVRIA